MTTPADREKERAKAQLREQRERERQERERERLARVERIQRAQQSSSGVASRYAAARDEDPDADSDVEAEASKKEYQQRVVQAWKDRAKKPRNPGSVIKFKTVLRNTILDVFRAQGWTESSSEYDWDIFWTNKEWIRLIYDKVHLEAHQRVNHFRNFYELTRKDLLVKNLKRARRDLAKREGGKEEEAADIYDFFPDTYSLPAEYSLFVEAFKKAPGISWIMKPIGSSQGKGIFLFERLSQISEWKNSYVAGGNGRPEDSKAEKYIVQRYLSNPLLIGGKKFDLRLYVLVTSYQPLTCYMYREGFARFSSTRFTMVKGDLTNNFVHLTNVAIQKKGDDYDADSGGKWDVRSLKLYLLHKYGDARVNALFYSIQLLCIRSLLAVQKVIISDRHSFEMYGYDVLIDADLKPWLIEVNASPSLTANTPKDYQMKLALLHDTMCIIDMEKKLTGLEEQVGGYDLIYRNGFVKFNQHCTFTTFLGAHNNRDKQLRKMWKSIRKKRAEQQQQQQQPQTQSGQPAGAQQGASNAQSQAHAGASGAQGSQSQQGGAADKLQSNQVGQR